MPECEYITDEKVIDLHAGFVKNRTTATSAMHFT